MTDSATSLRIRPFITGMPIFIPGWAASELNLAGIVPRIARLTFYASPLAPVEVPDCLAIVIEKL